MATSTLYNVKPFDGEGFSNWEFRVTLLLEQASVNQVLKQEPPDDATELEEFKKKDAKARNMLVQCTSDNMLELIKGKGTAKEIMDTLRAKYVKSGVATRVQLQRKLRSLHYVEGASMNLFLTEFAKTIVR